MPICLLRYDTESNDADLMAGFPTTLAKVHRQDAIPVTLFCTGAALEARRADFQAFAAETDGDPLFSIQDHSYSHIGIGYEAGQTVEVLRADYARSLDAHQDVLGRRPIGTAICGTSGRDGARLPGFDATAKAREELDMLAGLGIQMINTFLSDHQEHLEFCDYASLGHPEMTGFPSGYSDTGWLCQAPTPADGLNTILATIDRHADQGAHLAIICHDWAAWTRAGDQQLTHIRCLAEHARHRGYTLRTHAECHQNRALWR